MLQAIKSLSSLEIQNTFLTLDPKDHPSDFQYIGNKRLLFQQNPKIAVVGSRNITSYGQNILDQIIPDLCSYNFTIISGGAFGVDIQSQSKALHFSSNIITVLGSGLNHLSPKTNQPIFQKIIQNNGLICSPFPQNLKPTKYTFVQRNQHIAALSDIVLVIEAGEKSGSLHTARYAAEQGIQVACFPGSINQPLSKGTNYLIQQGAHLVTDIQDLVDLLPHNKKPQIKSSQDSFHQILDTTAQMAFNL